MELTFGNFDYIAGLGPDQLLLQLLLKIDGRLVAGGQASEGQAAQEQPGKYFFQIVGLHVRLDEI